MSARGTAVLVGAVTAVVAGVGGFFLGSAWVEFDRGRGGVDVEAARAEMEAEALLKKARREGMEDGQGKGVGAGEAGGLAEEASGKGKGERVSIRSILEQPGPMSRWQDMMDLAVDGDEEAVSKALEDLEELPVGIDTIVGKFFLYSRYADREPGTALEALEDLPADELDLARASILGGWAGRAPEEAAAFLMESANAEGRLEGVNNRMLGSVVGEWARTNPEAALEWSLKLSGESRKGALNALLEQWAYNAPENAAKAMEGIEPGEDRKDLFQKVALRWAQKDYAAALKWAEVLPEEERGPAIGKAVESWADDAPKAAADYIAGMEAGGPRDYAVRRTATSWAKEEPGEAAAWVLAQPENDQQRKAMRDVMGMWVKEDSLAASEWLAEQPQGPATDSAIVSLANAVSKDDPEGAAIWSASISNPIARAIQIKAVARGWLKRDREAARVWIESAEIDDKLREELLGGARR